MRYTILVLAFFNIVQVNAQDNSGVLNNKVKENGLQYVIHPAKESPRTEIRLIISAGSLMETPEQAGVAHFLEHIVFKKALLGHLEKTGVQLERDFNAATHYESTIYKVSVPNTPENINLCLAIFRNNIFRDLFKEVSATDIEKEKNVIIQELRDRNNEGPFYHEKIENSIFQNKLPGGTEEDIRKINTKVLEDYFKRWYTAGNAHVVIVGDVNSVSVEKKIRSLFNNTDSGNSASSHFPINYASLLPVHNIFSVETARQKNISADWMKAVQKNQPETPDDTKAVLVQKLYKVWVQQTLTNAGVQNTSFFDDWFLGNIFHTGFEIRAKDKPDLLKTYEQLGAVFHHIRKQSIPVEQFNNLKQKVLKNVSVPFPVNAQEIANYYEDIIGRHKYQDISADRNEQLPNILNEIKEEEIRNYNGFSLNNKPYFTLIKIPSKDITITEKELETAFIKGFESGIKIPAPQEAVKTETTKENRISNYVIKAPTAKFGHIIEEKYLPEVNLYRIALSNGISILLMPDKKAEKNTIVYFGRGGFLQLPDDEYPLYKDLNYYANQIGIKPYSYAFLSDILAQNDTTYSSYIGHYSNEIRISTPPEQLEFALKILYHSVYNYAAPVKYFRQDIKEKLREEETTESFSENEYAKFREAEELFLGNYRKTENKKLTRQELKKLNLKKLFSFYNSVFRNTTDRAVLISGNFTPEKVKDLVTAYFSAYPAEQKPLVWQINSSPDKMTEDFEPSNQTRKDVCFITKSELVPTAKNLFTIQIVKELLQSRFFETARNKYGKVYSPSVNTEYKAYPAPSVSFMVKFRSEKEDIPFLKEVFLSVVKDLQSNPVSPVLLENSKKAFSVAMEERISDPYAKEKELIQSHLDVLNTDDIENYKSLIHSITNEDIKAVLSTIKSIDAQIIQ